jgi:hypothetical protein
VRPWRRDRCGSDSGERRGGARQHASGEARGLGEVLVKGLGVSGSVRSKRRRKLVEATSMVDGGALCSHSGGEGKGLNRRLEHEEAVHAS